MMSPMRKTMKTVSITGKLINNKLIKLLKEFSKYLV
jgi:hypothetical protein